MDQSTYDSPDQGLLAPDSFVNVYGLPDIREWASPIRACGGTWVPGLPALPAFAGHPPPMPARPPHGGPWAQRGFFPRTKGNPQTWVKGDLGRAGTEAD